jgi:hypothetical protein
MAMITEEYVHDTELRRENAFENRLIGHMQVYIGGRSNHKRHERQRPEVAPERLLQTESFLPSRRTQDLSLQINSHDKHLHVTAIRAICGYAATNCYIRRIVYCKKKFRQHATREAMT